MSTSQTIEDKQLSEEQSEAGAGSTPLPTCRRIDPDVRRLVETGMNSSEIAIELGVESYHVRKTASWKAHVAERKRRSQNENGSDRRQKKVRRKYGSITVPRAKADVLENLKQSGARLADELMRSPNSYQCNYFLIKREAETICALLERFLVED